jgi:hypothetical protein
LAAAVQGEQITVAVAVRAVLYILLLLQLVVLVLQLVEADRQQVRLLTELKALTQQ